MATEYILLVYVTSPAEILPEVYLIPSDHPDAERIKKCNGLFTGGEESEDLKYVDSQFWHYEHHEEEDDPSDRVNKYQDYICSTETAVALKVSSPEVVVTHVVITGVYF